MTSAFEGVICKGASSANVKVRYDYDYYYKARSSLGKSHFILTIASNNHQNSSLKFSKSCQDLSLFTFLSSLLQTVSFFSLLHLKKKITSNVFSYASFNRKDHLCV